MDAIDYDDLKRRGLLLILPCKLGEQVYHVRKIKYDVDGYGMWWEEDWGIVTTSFHLGMLHEIGKTVFLDRDEAVKALRDIRKK